MFTESLTLGPELENSQGQVQPVRDRNRKVRFSRNLPLARSLRCATERSTPTGQRHRLTLNFLVFLRLQACGRPRPRFPVGAPFRNRRRRPSEFLCTFCRSLSRQWNERRRRADGSGWPCPYPV